MLEAYRAHVKERAALGIDLFEPSKKTNILTQEA